MPSLKEIITINSVEVRLEISKSKSGGMDISVVVNSKDAKKVDQLVIQKMLEKKINPINTTSSDNYYLIKFLQKTYFGEEVIYSFSSVLTNSQPSKSALESVYSINPQLYSSEQSSFGDAEADAQNSAVPGFDDYQLKNDYMGPGVVLYLLSQGQRVFLNDRNLEAFRQFINGPFGWPDAIVERDSKDTDGFEVKINLPGNTDNLTAKFNNQVQIKKLESLIDNFSENLEIVCADGKKISEASKKGLVDALGLLKNAVAERYKIIDANFVAGRKVNLQEVAQLTNKLTLTVNLIENMNGISARTDLSPEDKIAERYKLIEQYRKDALQLSAGQKIALAVCAIVIGAVLVTGGIIAGAIIGALAGGMTPASLLTMVMGGGLGALAVVKATVLIGAGIGGALGLAGDAGITALLRHSFLTRSWANKNYQNYQVAKAAEAIVKEEAQQNNNNQGCLASLASFSPCIKLG